MPSFRKASRFLSAICPSRASKKLLPSASISTMNGPMSRSLKNQAAFQLTLITHLEVENRPAGIYTKRIFPDCGHFHTFQGSLKAPSGISTAFPVNGTEKSFPNIVRNHCGTAFDGFKQGLLITGCGPPPAPPCTAAWDWRAAVQSNLRAYMPASHPQPLQVQNTWRRIRNAAQRIRAGEKITAVCQLCGYRDFSTFYRNFMKIMGVFPAQYADSAR